jgi:hypothetical protein
MPRSLKELSLKELQTECKNARSWPALHLILCEAYRRRYISHLPIEVLDGVEPFLLSSSHGAKELLYDPKITTDGLKKRGWTDKMISSFLPPPELAPNPYGSFNLMKVWSIERVVRGAEKPLLAELENNRNRKKVAA